MYIGKVIGTAVATRKVEELVGQKFLLVKIGIGETGGAPPPAAPVHVAADTVGAGVGETVIIALGGAAREITGNQGLPLDAAVIGIVSNLEIHDE
ncbi:MAG: EutN/CcmL family microcompartment protein [Gracilibacteraceae bacterium]|jgi:ethanolamine utilization protein EutN|nr:EutN/CcmL family microcompartment protein [Gracilibacteraceae bacterium]